MTDLNNGMYRCEKCNCELDKFNWRVILDMQLVDTTGHIWANCFQEQAEQVCLYN